MKTYFVLISASVRFSPTLGLGVALFGVAQCASPFWLEALKMLLPKKWFCVAFPCLIG